MRRTAIPSNRIKTLVLVGRTGNGKSATGNTILGRKAFKSRASSSGVTNTCELQNAALEDGQMLNVIDTPGLFDINAGSDFVGKEIVKCMHLAKDGIDALLLVLSVRTRFSEEEAAALRSLRNLFGSRIYKYMIVIFTGGDELEDDETLDDYLGRECPQPLKELLVLCENRRILFDNKTKDATKRAEQVHHLLSLVNMVIVRNDGRPYTELVGSLEGFSQEDLKKLEEEMHKSYVAELQQVTDKVKANLEETTTRLEQKLAEMQAAQMKAEELTRSAQKESNDEIRRLRKSVEKDKKETPKVETPPPPPPRVETPKVSPKVEEPSDSSCAIL